MPATAKASSRAITFHLSARGNGRGASIGRSYARDRLAVKRPGVVPSGPSVKIDDTMTTFTEKFTESDRGAFVACAIEIDNISEARRRAAAGTITGLSGPMAISQGYAHELVKRRREELEDAEVARMSAPEIAQRIIDREMARLAAASEAGTLQPIEARAMARALAEMSKLTGGRLVPPTPPPEPSSTAPETLVERLAREAEQYRDSQEAAERENDDENEDVIYDDDPRLLSGDDAVTARERNLAALQNDA